MPTPNDSDIFTDVVNSMMRDLHDMPYSVTTILSLLAQNLDSPVPAEIYHLSLSNLNTDQMAILVPALSKMTKLVSLALPECKPSSDHLKVLFTECPALSELQSLDLTKVEELKSEDLVLLSQSTTLTNLTHLNLQKSDAAKSRTAVMDRYHKRPVDPSGLVALLSSPVVKNLTHLTLHRCDLGDILIHTAIATSPFLANLVSLDLSGAGGLNAGIPAYAASTTLANITHLNLSSILGDALIAQLLSPPSLLAKKLQSLTLRLSKVTIASLRLLSEVAPCLTELGLEDNKELGERGAIYIAKHMPNLTKLDLSKCAITSYGYDALASSTTLTNLRELKLGGDCEEAEISKLVSSPVVANLTHLDLTEAGLDSFFEIARSKSLSNLRCLKLGQNSAGDEGMIELAQSTTLMNLVELDLSNIGFVTSKGVNALCTSPMASNLKSLSLHSNWQIKNSLAMALAAPSSTLYSLVELHLGQIYMDNQGMMQLLTTPNLYQLNSMNTDVPLGHETYWEPATKELYMSRFDRGLGP